MSWINHLPPACWSTFWKSNFKQQLGCRFEITDNESFFCMFWHMQLYMSWYIRSFFGFTFLNILYFFKYSCTNIFHRRSLYTFYSNRGSYTRKRHFLVNRSHDARLHMAIRADNSNMIWNTRRNPFAWPPPPPPHHHHHHHHHHHYTHTLLLRNAWFQLSYHSAIFDM